MGKTVNRGWHMLGVYEIVEPMGKGGMGESVSFPRKIQIVVNWLTELERLVPLED